MPRFFSALPEAVDAWVVFEPQRSPAWWSVLSPARWGHCWAFWSRYYPQPGLLSERFATKVEMVRGYLHVDTWMVDPEDIAGVLLQQGVTDIVRVRSTVAPGRGPVARGLITCVTVIKAALGIGAPWVLTPQQLHAYLRRHGAQSLRMEV